MRASGGDEPGDTPDLRHAYLVLAVIGLTGFQTSMALSIIFVAYPDIRHAFPNSSPVELSWVLNVFSIVGAPTMVLGSAVSERVGRKRAMLLGVAGFTAASVLAALAPTPLWIIGARGLMALAASLMLPVSAAMILREFPASHRGVAMGTWSAAGGLAAALGPSLGGWLIDNGGWQWAFWINVPIGIVSLITGAIVLRDSHEDERRPWPDAFGALVLMLGVGALVFGLVRTREWGWADPRELGMLAFGASLIALLIMRSRRHPEPIVRLELFSITPYRLGNAMMLFFSLSFFGFQFVSLQLLTGPWGYDLTKAGLLATPSFLCIAVMGPVSGRFTDRFGNWMLAPCGLVWVLSLAVFGLLLDGTPNMALWWIFVVVGGLGSGFVWGALFAMIMTSVPPADFSNGASLTQTLQRIGNALGVAVMVTVLSTTLTKGSVESFPKAFAVLAALGLVATVIGYGAARATDRPAARRLPHRPAATA